MQHKKMYSVAGSKQLTIDLPESFQGKDQVLIIIDDKETQKDDKINRLKEALNDPLFMADLHEVNQDFDAIDRESLVYPMSLSCFAIKLGR